MTLPRGPSPDYRRRKEPVLDDHLRASINQAGGLGKHHPETGHYAEVWYTGCATRERAKEIKQALFRSGRHVGVSVSADIVKAPDGTFTVKYKAIDKRLARQYVMQTYGTDKSLWPYNPREKTLKAE